MLGESKKKKMFTQQSLTCKGLERSLIKKKDLRLSHHNQYYIALATSQSSYTGALYILDPLCAPPTVPAGLIALMDLLELPRHQRQATGHRGHALDGDYDMLWSTYRCGSQIATLSLSYHGHLLAQRIRCPAPLTISSFLCSQSVLFERSL